MLFKGFTKNEPSKIRSQITQCLSWKHTEFLWILLSFEKNLILDRKLLNKLQEYVETEKDWKILLNLYLNAQIEPSQNFLFSNYQKKKEKIKKILDGKRIGKEHMLCLEYSNDLKMTLKEYTGKFEKMRKY